MVYPTRSKTSCLKLITGFTLSVINLYNENDHINVDSMSIKQI
jgi:hypothetical protein